MVDVDNLKGLGAIKKYKKDEYIYKQGESGSKMYIILSGEVHFPIDPSDNQNKHVSTMGSGEFFGEMSVLENLSRNTSAIAATNTVVLAIDKTNFELFINKQPAMAYKLMKGLSFRIRCLDKKIQLLNAEIQKHINDKNVDKKIADKEPEITENTNTNPYSSTNVVKTNLLFPPEHNVYNTTAPETDSTYLRVKEVECPVCNREFNVDAFRVSKLRLENMDYDFRKRYKGFEPLWYSIWVCPHCLYSSYYFDFDTFPHNYARMLIQKNMELKNVVSTEFTNPRTVQQVFTSYYLALRSTELCPVNPLKAARLWLQLSWLYNDEGDKEMHNKASHYALENYYNAYYKESLDISIQDEQQLLLILGELFLIKDNTKEALNHFFKAINNKSGIQRLNQQAQDRIQYVRDMYKHKP